jgi:hypothetical protein
VQQLQALLLRQQPSPAAPLPTPSSSLLPPPLYQSDTSLNFPHSKALSPPRPPRTQSSPTKDATPTPGESQSKEGGDRKGSPSPPRPKGGAKSPSPTRARPKAASPKKPEAYDSEASDDEEEEEEASVLRPIRLQAPSLDDLPPLPASPTEAAGQWSLLPTRLSLPIFPNYISYPSSSLTHPQCHCVPRSPLAFPSPLHPRSSLPSPLPHPLHSEPLHAQPLHLPAGHDRVPAARGGGS